VTTNNPIKIQRDMNSIIWIDLFYESHSTGGTVEQFQSNNHQGSLITYDQNNYFGDTLEIGNYVSNNNNGQIGCIEGPPFPTSPFMNGIIPYSFLDTQSDGGDLTPSSSGPIIDRASRWH